MQLRNILTFTLLAVAALLPIPAGAATPVSGSISANTTWNPAGSPYIITTTVTVAPGVTLTVAAGTVVKFGSGASLIVNGTLSAAGISGSTIHFTDLRDDAVGGDTNGDGGATLPAAGGWQNINVSEGGSAVLDYCAVRFGGGATGGALYKYGGGSLTLRNSTVSDSSSSGITYVAGISTAGSITLTGNTISVNGSDGIKLSGSTGTIAISGTTVTGNGGNGIFIDSGSLSLQNNTLTGNGAYGMRLMGGTLTSASGNTASGNLAGAVRIRATYLPSLSANSYTGRIEIDGGILTQTSSLVAGTSYVVVSTFEVGTAVTLTVPAGTVVKSGPGSGILVSGTLNATGVSGNLVHFSDLRDDSVGGDTNGDGAASAPAAGGWNGISVQGSASLAFSSIRYATTNVTKFGAGSLSVSNSLAGNASGAGISISGSAGSHSVTTSTIINNGSDGVRSTGNSGTLSVTGSSITGNSGSGIFSDSGALTLQNSSITGNSGYALNLSGGTLPTPVTGNTFSGNSAGAFRLMAGHLQPLSATTYTGIIVIAGGTIASTTTLKATTPYVVEAIFTIADTTGVLNVPAGTVVKFASGAGIDVFGTLNASGAPGSMVYFTDLRDDSAGGDTNGDGPGSGVPGGWRGILHGNGTIALGYCNIRFGVDNVSSTDFGVSGSITISNSTVSNASGSGILLVLNYSSLTVTNSTISYNGADGIQLAYYFGPDGSINISGSMISYNAGRGIYSEGAGTNPVIRNSIIAKNSVGVFATSGALPVIGGSATPGTGNSIFQNGTFGVLNDYPVPPPVNATHNWWGSSTGPRHAGNPAGTGSAVSDYVDFANFLAAPTFSGAVASFTPELLDFKRVPLSSMSAAQNITVVNISSQPLPFGTVVRSGLNPDVFQVTADSCSTITLAPGASCVVTVTFTPSDKLAYSARIDFPAGGASVLPLYSVALNGAGFTPVTLPFSDDFIGSISPDWTIINPTATPYSLLASRMIGTDNEVGLVRVATSATNLFGPTTNAYNIFTLALPTGVAKLMVTTKMNFQYPPVLDQYQGGIIILPEQNSQPDLTNFIRTQFGRWNGVITFQTTTNVNSVGTSTTWSQPAPPANWYWLRLVKRGTNYQSLFSTDGINFTPWRSDTLQQEAAYAGLFALHVTGRTPENLDFGLFEVKALPTISVPAGMAFGNVPLGTAQNQRTITISNTGSGPLTISSLAINGSNAPLFSAGLGTCNVPVPAGGSCHLSVTLDTATLGSYSASLVIGSDDIDAPTVPVALSGSVTAPTNLSVGILGTGGGTVRHMESDAVCGTSCSVISTAGATATFQATPDDYSLFTGWGGSCSGSAACSFTTPGATGGVTATFDRDNAHAVKIEPGTFFPSVMGTGGAYASASTSGITAIKTWGASYTEPLPLLFDQPVQILLDGGYDGTFTVSNGQMTTFTGPMSVKPHTTLGNGRVAVRNIRIKAAP